VNHEQAQEESVKGKTVFIDHSIHRYMHRAVGTAGRGRGAEGEGAGQDTA
jgi:hypothetical protein